MSRTAVPRPFDHHFFADMVAARAYKSSAGVPYHAEKSFWEAKNICGFEGDAAAWCALLEEEAAKYRAAAPEKK